MTLGNSLHDFFVCCEPGLLYTLLDGVYWMMKCARPKLDLSFKTGEQPLAEFY